MIEKIFDFIIEIDQLKNILRKTRPIGVDRYENSAEHSWQVCLAALMLKDHSNEPIDIERVIKMLLIHDLGEIDAGDTIVYQEDTETIKQAELAGVTRVLGLLPESMARQYIALWQEFEFGDSAEAKFARAVDRIPPVLHNLHGDLHAWKKHRIPLEKVRQVNSKIALGSQSAWEIIESQLDEIERDGRLDDLSKQS